MIVPHLCYSKTFLTIYTFPLACRQQLAWMADFVESEDNNLSAILHNFSAAQHGKGPADFEAGAKFSLMYQSHISNVFCLVLNCAAFHIFFVTQAKLKQRQQLRQLMGTN